MCLYGSVTSVTSVRLCFGPRCDKNKTTSPGLVRQRRRNSIHSKIQPHRRHDPRPRLCEFRHVKHGFRDATDDDSHQDHSQKSTDQSREHHFLTMSVRDCSTTLVVTVVLVEWCGVTCCDGASTCVVYWCCRMSRGVCVMCGVCDMCDVCVMCDVVMW